MYSISLLSVLVAAIAAFVVGFLFHGPLFGKLWMRLANIKPTGKEKFADMLPQMGWNLLANIVTAYILAMIIYVAGIYHGSIGTVSSGLLTSFWVWLGFVVTGSSMDVIWMGKSKKLWLFEIASSLAMYLVMGAILAAW
jgi:hypothetical protein